MATQKQINFMSSLIIQKEVPEDLKAKLIRRLSDNDMDGHTASKTIEWLLARPDKNGAPSSSNGAAPPTELEAKIPAGHYALLLDQPDAAGNKVHFYSVDKPGADSKWHGRTFVNQEIGGRDDDIPIRNPVERTEVLRRIALDPAGCLLRYGQLIGKCGHCGRKLTNDESRSLGIGPVCRKQDGARWGL